MKKLVFGFALAALFPQTAFAQEALKVAIGQIENWENQPPTIGRWAGIFTKHRVEVENLGTGGEEETLQAVVSGSADIGVGVGVSGVLRAFSRGEPVRILLPSYTGTSDLYWYVKADSPIKKLKDATEKKSIAYSSNGSSSNSIVTAFAEEFGLKAKPIATGGQATTLAAVLSDQVNIGWANAPFGLKEVNEGRIRVIARGSDVRSLHGQTVRVVVASADALAKKKEATDRFAKAYRETVDWIYDDFVATSLYAEKFKLDEPLVKQSITQYQTPSALQTDEMKDFEGAIRNAVKLKFLDKPLTPEQTNELIQIPTK